MYEVNTSELYATMEVYPYYRAFSNAYCKECTKEEYDKAIQDENDVHYKKLETITRQGEQKLVEN